MSWVAEELWDVDLGDARRNRRLVKIVEDLMARPNESVPQAIRDEAAVQGVYGLLCIAASFFTNRIIIKELTQWIFERSPSFLIHPPGMANLRKVHAFYDKASRHFSLMEEMLRSLQETPNVDRKRLNVRRRKGLKRVRETRF
jgi:hypothetical protein